MNDDNEHFAGAFDMRIEVPAMPLAAQRDFARGLLAYCAAWRQPKPDLRAVSPETAG